jgi:predicted DNA-binding protein
MLSIRLAPNVEKSIEQVAAKMKITKAAFLREAITEYLEDRMDYLEACKILEEEGDMELPEFKASDYER